MVRKTAAIVQSCYIPWKGYFDLINMVDEFVLYDDVQFTRRDWRNRNRIKTPQGLQWLSVPVEVKGKYHQSIKDTLVSESSWGRQHWDTLRHNYARATYFERYAEIFKEIYLTETDPHLSRINLRFIEAVCGILGIGSRITWSMDYELADGKSERLLGLCQAVGCNRYLSGPSARDYMDLDLFAAHDIEVEFMDYSGYPEHPQLFGPFEHHVTILDLIFNVGPAARTYMKSFGRQ